MASGLITDFIDEKAFEQFTKLKTHLTDSQTAMKSLADEVIELNKELSKSKSTNDLTEAIKQSADAIEKLTENEKEQTKQYAEVTKAKQKVVDQSKKNIKASIKESKTLDDLIKRQVDLKTKIKERQVEQKSLTTLLAWNQITQEEYTKKVEEAVKQEFIHKEALKATNKEIRDTVKASENAKGSYDEMNRTLLDLRKEYNALSTAQRANEDIGVKMLKTIQDLDNELKELDKNQGIYNRNVGNYQSAFEGLGDAMNEFIPGYQNITQQVKIANNLFSAGYQILRSYVMGTKAAAGANKIFSTSLKIVRATLIATGLGAIVVILGSLIAYLTSTQEGIDRINRVMQPLKAMLGVITTAAADMGRVIMQAFDDPVQGIKDLGDLILNNVLNRFKAFIVIYEGFKNLDLKQVTNGMLQVATGVEDVVDKTEDMVDAFDEASKTGSKMARLQEDIAAGEQNLTLHTSRLNRMYREGAEIASDRSKSEEDRKQNAERALSALNSLATMEITQQQKVVELIEIQNKAKGEGNLLNEDEMKLRLAKAKLDDIMANVSNKSIRVTSQFNQVNMQQARDMLAASKAQIAAEQKAADEKKKLSDEEKKRNKENHESALKRGHELSILMDEVSQNTANEAAKTNKKIADDDKKSLIERLQALKDYQDNKLESIEAGYSIEYAKINEANDEITQLRIEGREKEADVLQQITDIQLKESAKKEIDLKTQLSKEISSIQLQIAKDNLDAESRLRMELIEDSGNAELLALKELYATGAIDKEAYEKRKLEIQNEYAEKRINSEISTLEQLISVEKARGIDVGAMERDLARLKMDLAEQSADKQISEAERSMEAEKVLLQKRQEILKELGSLAINLVTQSFEQRMNQLAVEGEKVDDNYTRQKEIIENTVLDETEKNMRLSMLERDRTDKQIEIEKEKNRLKEKQAKFEKAAALSAAIIQTAKAVISVLPNIPLSIAMGVLGAVQIAKIASEPIPKFEKGIKSSPQGLAIVGERGHELMMDRSGNASLTPDKSTMTFLKQGTRIFNASETKKILAGDGISGNDFGQNLSNMASLINAVGKGNKGLIEAISGQKKETTNFTWDENGVRRWTQKGNNYTDWVNKMIN